MDCNQRIAFSLFGALILCALGAENLTAQDKEFSASPGVNAPKTLSNDARLGPGGNALQRPLTVPNNSPYRDSSSAGATSFASIPTEQTVPTDQTSTGQTLTPLKRRSGLAPADETGSSNGQAGESSAGAFLAVLVVLLVFMLGLAKLFLKRSPYSISNLPADAVDVLGRRAVDPRNSVYMIKVGSRLLLMGSSPNGLSGLAEISDPIEVASLTNVCAAARQTGPDATKWLSKLWPTTTTVVESRPFDDQLGEKLFAEAQQGESGRVDSLTIATGREQHRAG